MALVTLALAAAAGGGGDGSGQVAVAATPTVAEAVQCGGPTSTGSAPFDRPAFPPDLSLSAERACPVRVIKVAWREGAKNKAVRYSNPR